MNRTTTALLDAEVLHDTPTIEALLQETRISRADEDAYSLVQTGTCELLGTLLASNDECPQRLDRSLIDTIIETLDERLSAQVDRLLHHPDVKHLEAQWRGLKYLVDEIDFRENVRLEVLQASKEELSADFDESPELPSSGLYHHVYRQAFGVLGGKPYGVVTTTYELGAGSEDCRLLRNLGALGAMAHVPVLSNAGPAFFGVDSLTELNRVKDLQSHFEGPSYARWSSLRDREDSRYLGLCLPRFLLRSPYGKRESETPVKSFAFSEQVIGDHDAYLWGPASLALTARIAASYAKYRWCPNIIGPQGGGAVLDLPLHDYEVGGEIQVKNPCEASIDDRLEYQLAEQGFIGLVFRKESDNAAFFSACSVQRPRSYADTPEGQAAQTSHLLGSRLPYMFVITRLAHYLKVLQREQIGSWKGRADLERELNQWIRQYVADMADPSPETRSRKPLRRARVTVAEVEGQVGWYRCGLTIEPHLKYEGAEFTLSLVGKLDKG